MATAVTAVSPRYRFRRVVGPGLPGVVVAPGGVADQPGLAEDDGDDDRGGEGPAEPVLPRLKQGHVEVVGDEGEEAHRLDPRGPGREPLEQGAGPVVVVLARGLIPLDLRVVLPDAFHRLGDRVTGAGLRADERLPVLGDLVEVLPGVLDEALGLVEARVGLLLEPAPQLLLTVGDERLGQAGVVQGRGLPAVARSAATLVLLDDHAGVFRSGLVLVLGDRELAGFLWSKSPLPALLRDIRHGHDARLLRLVDHLMV